MAIGAASAVCLVAEAVLLAGIISRVFLQRSSLGHEAPPLLWLASLTVVRAGLAWVAETAAHRTSARAKRDLRQRLAQHTLLLGPRLGGEQRGELILAATRGVDALDAYFARYLPQLVLSVLVPVAVLAWVLRIDRISALIIAVTLPLMPLFGWLIGRAAQAPARRQWQLLAQLSGHFLDVVRGLPTLRLFDRSRAQAELIERASEDHRRLTMRTLRVAFVSAFALETVAAVATALVAVSIGLRLVDGRMTLAAGLAVLFLTPEVFVPLRQASTQFHASVEGMAAAERIFDVLSMGAPFLAAAGQVPDPAVEVIRFENVTVAYEGRIQPALDRLDLEIHPGERVALTGPSGAGKSTVLALLMGFAEPAGGRITVGGIDLASVPPGPWREAIAWVPQRPHIFHGTVSENLLIARPQATASDVRGALELAGAWEFVEELPAGLSTVLGERGEGLSAGQRQRIAIARAFLRGGRLLLLDEPTSSLDPESEAVVAEALERLMAGRTAIVVAHTPALAAGADRIVRLESGRATVLRSSTGERSITDDAVPA